MTAKVRVRMYNVGFGDCFLLFLPDAERPEQRDRVVLVDCGRHSGTFREEPPFWDVVKQVVADLPVVDGHRFVDVLVMTHRHRDHVHGFSQPEHWRDVRAGEVWMPWTENKDDPAAETLRLQQEAAASRSFHALRAFGVDDSPALAIALNSMTNQDAMDTIRSLGPVQYLPDPLRPQATVLSGKAGADRGLPAGVTVHVLGPSRDKKTITTLDPPSGASYLRLVPAAGGREGGPPEAVPAPWDGYWDLPEADYKEKVGDAAALVKPKVLRGVERAAQEDAAGLALAVDKALNGTSLVLLFEIGKLCLLFAGDAQWGTWKAMLANKDWEQKLRAVDFLKVGHHGSHNATPVDYVENYLKNAVAMIPVCPTSYKSEGWTQIPKPELLEAMQLDGRVRLLVRADEPPPESDMVTVGPGGLWTEVALDVDGER